MLLPPVPVQAPLVPLLDPQALVFLSYASFNLFSFLAVLTYVLALPIYSRRAAPPAKPNSARSAGHGGSSNTMLKLYTDDSPGLRVCVPAKPFWSMLKLKLTNAFLLQRPICCHHYFPVFHWLYFLPPHRRKSYQVFREVDLLSSSNGFYMHHCLKMNDDVLAAITLCAVRVFGERCSQDLHKTRATRTAECRPRYKQL